MEGDYKGFDCHMPFEIGWAAATLISNIMGEMGYSPTAKRALENLLCDELFPYLEVLQDLFCAPGFQPSGKYGTAENNTLRGLIMLIYAWFNIVGEDIDPFDHIEPMIFGDDLLCSVSDDFIGAFNNVTYANFCSEYYGMTYTAANKGSELTEYLMWEEVTFLKRCFKYNSDLDLWQAPLDLDSIFKMVSWTLLSGNVSEFEQHQGAFSSFCWEIFPHSTSQAQYERITTRMSNILSDYHGTSFEPIKYFDIINAYEQAKTA